MVRGSEVGDGFIEAANDELKGLRQNTQDLVLTPLFGNNATGTRRGACLLLWRKNIVHSAAKHYVKT